MHRNVTFGCIIAMLAAGCATPTREIPDLDQALARHIASIQERDLDAFRSTLTSDETLYMILPNGDALTTPAEALDLHEGWFADTNWRWDGKVVHTITGTDMAMVLMQYEYRASPDADPSSTWLGLVFRLEGNEWRLVHDQNTGIPRALHADD